MNVAATDTQTDISLTLGFCISASCGSCYAFASMAMNEARVRIMTNNTKQPVFSPQDIVDCSEYSQGNHKSKTEVAVSVQKRTA